MGNLYFLSFLYCHCYSDPVLIALLQLDRVTLHAGNFCNETPNGSGCLVIYRGLIWWVKDNMFRFFQELSVYFALMVRIALRLKLICGDQYQMDLFSTCRRKWQKCLFPWWHFVMVLKVHYLTDVSAQEGWTLKHYKICYWSWGWRMQVWTFSFPSGTAVPPNIYAVLCHLGYTDFPLASHFNHGVSA